MRKIILLAAAVTLVVAFTPTGMAEGRPFPECPENTGRTVTLSCVPGAAAGVAGVYGGGSFGLVCDGDRSTATVCTQAGNNDWAVSGAASLRDGRQVRFADNGNSRTAVVRVEGGEVRLTIH